MKVKVSANVTSAATECFLYAIVIIQTAVAVIAYKTMSQNAMLWSSAILYLSIIYFGVLGWVFYQLNQLYRDRRKLVQADANTGSPVPATPPFETAGADRPPVEVSLSAPGQMEESAPESAGASAAVTKTAPARLVFGVTYTKLAIALLVFVAALKVFSWALANLLKP